MKVYLLAGAALASLATPAAARDNSAYFGIEAGPMWLRDSDVEIDDVDVFSLDHKMGVDGDLILGYDFGLFRTEIEAAYKWAEFDGVSFADEPEDFDLDGHSRAYSIMGNAMVDLGDNERVNFYLGAGAGLARFRSKTESDEEDADIDFRDTNFAWQIIAGVRAPVFTHFDVGLKYRYFNGGNIDDDLGEDNLFGDQVETDWKSHSILASLIYNWTTPPAPPPPPMVALPPPPPAPATQTCPDGSVVLATDPCPMPPPPPPPPPPAPERG